MNRLIKKQSVERTDVESLLSDGIIELSGDKGKRLRFGFMAAIEHEGDLYLVLTKIAGKHKLGHELLLLRLLKTGGHFEDYEVVHDPLQATELIDQYVRMAVQALFETVAEEGATSEESDWETDEDDEDGGDFDGVVH